jgi:hypothetical protein
LLPFGRALIRDAGLHATSGSGRHWTTVSRLCIIWLAVVITLALAE